jgi:hypothetical protein
VVFVLATGAGEEFGVAAVGVAGAAAPVFALSHFPVLTGMFALPFGHQLASHCHCLLTRHSFTRPQAFDLGAGGAIA